MVGGEIVRDCRDQSLGTRGLRCGPRVPWSARHRGDTRRPTGRVAGRTRGGQARTAPKRVAMTRQAAGSGCARGRCSARRRTATLHPHTDLQQHEPESPDLCPREGRAIRAELEFLEQHVGRGRQRDPELVGPESRAARAAHAAAVNDDNTVEQRSAENAIIRLRAAPRPSERCPCVRLAALNIWGCRRGSKARPPPQGDGVSADALGDRDAGWVLGNTRPTYRTPFRERRPILQRLAQKDR